MSKFVIERNEVTTKKGMKMEKICIKAKSEKNLITYKDIENLYNKMKTQYDTKNMKIVGNNRYTMWTLKSQGVDDIDTFEDYFGDDPVKDKVNGFYSVLMTTTKGLAKKD